MNAIWHLARTFTDLGHTIVNDPSLADVVHGHAFDGSPQIYTSHGVYPDDHPNAYANEMLYNNVVAAEVVTAVSEWTANLIKRPGVNPVVIHNGVDIEGIQKYKLPKSNYVLWGKATADKVSNAEAFLELANKWPELRFVMIVAPEGVTIPNNVRVIGIQPYGKMMGWLSGAMAYVSTGTENFPLQALEAMALGVPVVALPRGGVTEIGGIAITEDLAGGLANTLNNSEAAAEYQLDVVRSLYTWDKIAKKYLDVYANLPKPEPHRVSVVIPCYNLAHKVSRAVDSCLHQSKIPDEIIVVDDGSKDDPAKELAGYGSRITFVRQDNQGVAAARNNGIRQSKGDFVICLDADDALSPGFVAKASKQLAADFLLAIAYPGMKVVDDSGRIQGDHPGESKPNLNELSKGNFIPCANMFRRKAWEQVGGYKNINPSWEDYELWLAMMELGWSAALVNGERLIYTASDSGRTGEVGRGNHDKLLRATVDGYHPNLYDNSGWVTFVIPCYNQWEYVYDAVQSAWNQTYAHIEVIVVNDASTRLLDAQRNRIRVDFPKTRFIDHKINRGLSAARNTGIKNARGAWIVPLDADDKVESTFVAECLKLVYNSPNFAYTDIYIWHNLGKGPVEKQEMATFAPDRLRDAHQHACTILVQKEWIEHAGMYDENMLDGWEDYELTIRLVKAGHCGTRVPQHLFYYRWRPGSMRQDAETKREKITRYMWGKHPDVANGGSLMACCGGNPKPLQDGPMPMNVENTIVPEGFVMLQYTGRKEGDMRKVGGDRRIYGYSALDPLFLVHEDDLLLFDSPTFLIAKKHPVQEENPVVEAVPSVELDINDILPEGSDNLTALEGLDEAVQEKLYEMGINTYQRFIAAPDEQYAGILSKPKLKKARALAMDKLRESVGV